MTQRTEESEQARCERVSAEERARHAEVTRRQLEARFGIPPQVAGPETE